MLGIEGSIGGGGVDGLYTWIQDQAANGDSLVLNYAEGGEYIQVINKATKEKFAIGVPNEYLSSMNKYMHKTYGAPKFQYIPIDPFTFR